jgi:hypothetical protein
MLGLGISVMMLTSALPYNAVASVEQSLHNQTLEEIVRQKDVPVIIPQVDTNSRPEYMELFPDTNSMYVSEPDSKAISIISTKNHTKIKDIRVEGSPTIIESVDLPLNNTKGEEYLNTIFVTSRKTNNIFVISIEDNTKIKDIKVIQ